MPHNHKASMHRVLLRASATLLLSAAVACGNDPSDPPADPLDPSVYVAGEIRDENGAPVPFAVAVWEAWPLPDSTKGAVAGTSNSVRWHGRADSLGRFAAHLAYYSIPQLDSLEVTAATDDCWGYEPAAVRDRAIPLSAQLPDTVFNRTLIFTRTAARARLALGPACAVIVDTLEGFDSKLGIWIDDISDSVRGRWRINYGWSRGDDIGQFSGWRAEDSVFLDLRLDTPYETPMGLLCTGYTLELTLEAGDTIGPSRYESESCQFKPMPLRFVEGDPVEWPF